jgi:hypothetical protein
MNPIKKLYQKLLGSSDNKEEPVAKDEEELILHIDKDSSCYLLFEVDPEGIVKMSSYWDGSEASIFAFTELLFNLSNGKMSENIFEFLERECEEDNYTVFLQIVAIYSQLLRTGLEELSGFENIRKDLPVVKPSDLSKNNANPFDMR